MSEVHNSHFNRMDCTIPIHFVSFFLIEVATYYPEKVECKIGDVERACFVFFGYHDELGVLERLPITTKTDLSILIWFVDSVVLIFFGD